MKKSFVHIAHKSLTANTRSVRFFHLSGNFSFAGSIGRKTTKFRLFGGQPKRGRHLDFGRKYPVDNFFGKFLEKFTASKSDRNMKYAHLIVPAVLAVILSISSKRAAAQPVCSSSYIDNPQNRKLCLTLANFFGLPNSLDSYPDDMRPNYGYKIPVGYKGRIPSPDFIENMPGTKRQDVDHVFLRFGRRR